MFLYKLALMQLLSVMAVNSEYSSIDLNRNYEYDKYLENGGTNTMSSKQQQQQHMKIPTLESLFHVVSFRDNSNSSSPCTHKGRKRQTMCHKVYSFDRDGYEKSIQDTKKLILNRLNLDHEPVVKINKNTLSFIDQLENKILSENEPKGILKTKYDMKTPQNRIFNSMHEAIRIEKNCETASLDEYEYEEESSDSNNNNNLCVKFQVPLKHFVNRDMSLRHTKSADLWIYMKSSSNVDLLNNLNIQLINFNHPDRNKIVRFQSLVDGWNTIDITSLIQVPNLDMSKEENRALSMNFTLVVKCLGECNIDFKSLVEQMDDVLTNDDQTTTTNNAAEKIIIVNYAPGKKPLVSLNIEEKEEIVSPMSNGKRAKRKVHGHTQSSYKVSGLDRDEYQPKYCQNNYPDADRECCLITYFVNFNSLKWSSWILSPAGFVANYCSGKCNDIRSIHLTNKFHQFLLDQ